VHEKNNTKVKLEVFTSVSSELSVNSEIV